MTFRTTTQKKKVRRAVFFILLKFWSSCVLYDVTKQNNTLFELHSLCEMTCNICHGVLSSLSVVMTYMRITYRGKEMFIS